MDRDREVKQRVVAKVTGWPMKYKVLAVFAGVALVVAIVANLVG